MKPLLRLAKGGARSLLQQAAARMGPHRHPSTTPRLWILMYHRVLPAGDPRARYEEPGMMVTPDTFRRQMLWMKQHLEPVRLGDWVARRTAGEPLPLRACAVTFDDGWRDNHEFALPILRELGLPATVFAVSHMIGTRLSFWPNRLARLLARAGERAADEASFAWLRERVADLPQVARNPEHRAAAILACKALDDDTLAEHLSRMERALGPQTLPPDLMDWEQLRELARSGLFEIGSHTCHHTRLVQGLPGERAAREIRDSRERLENKLQQPVELFCYPNGDYSAEAEALVRATYRGAVTTRRGINRAEAPVTTLARIGIHEDIARTRTAFMARLSGWRV